MITNLADALKIMIARYATLVTYYARLAATAKKSGKPVPKDGMLTYNAAVADYMRYANDVWKVIIAKKLTIEMVKFGPDGKPMKDPKRPGHILTKRIGIERMPLRPPIYVAPGVPYPSANAPYPAPRVSGDVAQGDFSGSDIGFGWKEVGMIAVVVVLGTAAAAILGTAVIAYIVIGAASIAIAAQGIAVAIRGPSADVIESLDAYARIHDKALAAKLKAGMPAAQAEAEAHKEALEALEQSRKAPETGGGFGVTGMILGLAAIGGGVLLLTRKSAA